jgi:hypothetical protein
MTCQLPAVAGDQTLPESCVPAVVLTTISLKACTAEECIQGASAQRTTWQVEQLPVQLANKFGTSPATRIRWA